MSGRNQTNRVRVEAVGYTTRGSGAEHARVWHLLTTAREALISRQTIDGPRGDLAQMLGAHSSWATASGISFACSIVDNWTAWALDLARACWGLVSAPSCRGDCRVVDWELKRGRIMRRVSPSHRGQSLLEFALVLPILLIITFGIIEFGILIYNQQIITNASREGARAGIVASAPRVPPSGMSSIDAVVQQYCANNLISFDAQSPPVTTVVGYDANAPFRQNLQVQVSYQYSFLVVQNFVPGLNRVRSVNAVAVMRYE